jgi:AraC-like DNA-binding protein
VLGRDDWQDATMIGGHRFKRIRHEERLPRRTVRPNEKSLLALLSQKVVKRFARLTGPALVAVPLSVSGSKDSESPPGNPGHPACSEHAGTDYCRESWLLHLAQLSCQPETHWHKCDFGRLCALVPVVRQGRCLAVVKLACSSCTPEVEFERQVELLDILVKDFVVAEAEFLERLPNAVPPGPDLRMPPASGDELLARQPASHPQIIAALQYVEGHLSDPALAVTGIARHVELHPNYLSSLFTEHTGQRLSRFIALRRIEQAQTLLLTTQWPIKRVARETGHANPNWFSFVFRALVGTTPGEYRKRLRGPARGAPNP